MSKDALENLQKLPRWCYGMVAGRAVSISRGAPDPMPVSVSASNLDRLNLDMGVTRNQRLAMEAGVVFGWNTTGADPDTHAALEDRSGEGETYTVSFPVVYRVKVKAHSPQHAMEIAACEMCELPAGFELDGLSWVSEIE